MRRQSLVLFSRFRFWPLSESIVNDHNTSLGTSDNDTQIIVKDRISLSRKKSSRSSCAEERLNCEQQITSLSDIRICMTQHAAQTRHKRNCKVTTIVRIIKAFCRKQSILYLLRFLLERAVFD